MSYLISSSLIITCFMAIKKTDFKQNILSALSIAIIAYECYLCTIAGIMGICNIPTTTYSVSLTNIIVLVGMIVWFLKKKSFQSYYIDIADTFFIFFLGIIVVQLFIKRFSPELNIVFSTSDPGVHLKMAHKFIKNEKVDGMYIGQLINGLLIESTTGFFSGIEIYKPYLVQIGLNLFLSGFIFWAMVSQFRTNIFSRIVTYGITIVYILGYPYNDMLYGFVYLQMTITVICYICTLLWFLLNDNKNKYFWGTLISMGCLTVGIGYTFFAPPVYIAVLGCISYKAYQEKWLLHNKKIEGISQFCLYGLYIFAIPCAITLWFTVIAPKLEGTSVNYGNALLLEGGIYRNLFSDFYLWIIPALYGFVITIKRKKHNFVTYFIPVFIFYYIFFLWKMLSEQISTYYFYKLNYLFWLLILLAFTYGILELRNNEKVISHCLLVCILFLIGVRASKFEYIYNEKNSNYIPYIDASVFFRINNFNNVCETNYMQKSNEYLEITNQALKVSPSEPVFFIGYWENLFWYEALTGWEYPYLYYHTYDEQLKMFMNNQYGKYSVISKEADIDENYRQYIEKNMIFENNYGYIIKSETIE